MKNIVSKLSNRTRGEIALITLIGVIIIGLITLIFNIKPNGSLSSVFKIVLFLYVFGFSVFVDRTTPEKYKWMVCKNKKYIWNIKHLGMLFALTAFYLFLFMTPIFIAGYYYFKR